MTTRTASATYQYSPGDVLPDPPRKHDMQQRAQFYRIDSALKPHYAHRKDVLVCGEGYLRQDASNNAEQFAPDCVVAFGVEPDAIVGRNGYVISEVGKPPDLVLEVASRSTGRRDYTVKLEAYARYMVQEYWLFDETGGRYHRSALSGYTLENGVYAPLPIHHEPDGLIWGHSEVLGLDVCWDKGQTRFYDPAAGRYLPNAEELKEERDSERDTRLAAETQRDSERDARLAAENQRDFERDTRLTAENQRDFERDARLAVETQRDSERDARLVAEAELRQLREQLRRLRE